MSLYFRKICAFCFPLLWPWCIYMYTHHALHIIDVPGPTCTVTVIISRRLESFSPHYRPCALTTRTPLLSSRINSHLWQSPKTMQQSSSPPLSFKRRHLLWASRSTASVINSYRLYWRDKVNVYSIRIFAVVRFPRSIHRIHLVANLCSSVVLIEVFILCLISKRRMVARYSSSSMCRSTCVCACAWARNWRHSCMKCMNLEHVTIASSGIRRSWIRRRLRIGIRTWVLRFACACVWAKRNRKEKSWENGERRKENKIMRCSEYRNSAGNRYSLIAMKMSLDRQIHRHGIIY